MAALYKEQLGRVIKRRREDLGLTQRQLADLVNVEEAQTVSRWERGLNSPTDLEVVASGLQTTAADILKELEPLANRERRRMLPTELTQLDRIESKLDQLIRRLGADDYPDPPAELLSRPPGQKPKQQPGRRSGSDQGKDALPGDAG